MQWGRGMLWPRLRQNDTYQDIFMGYMGGDHGAMLRSGEVGIREFWRLLYDSLEVNTNE